ncbi:hypothetical protein BV25DRAFT_1949230 [Artomyces pyxidatus]|uniref:Uncharacterized protein n=1 Tax=Artomyces pyxidatus TaxID=48021 RepID=A0ACB8SZW2_9AGAM|nr:hypothetical protein BV25DRAFT_1949230 [Artomyces pyxidatus]
MAVITDCPPEVIDVIAGWIDSPDDALSISLASRGMASVISPRHTQLRVIICPIDSRCVWSLLANDAALARNVRVLWLTINSGRLRIPQAFHKERHDCNHCSVQRLSEAQQVKMEHEDERMFMAALKNMVNLTHFDWRHPQTNRMTAASQPDGQDIWTALASCPNMTDLRLYEGGWCNIWGSADLRLEMYCDYSMELRVAACHSTHTFVSFVEAHPGLRHLSIDDWVGCTAISDVPDEDELDRMPEPLSFTFTPGILPNLETLECHPGQAIDILSSACSQPRRNGQIVAHIIRDGANPFLRLAEFMTLAATLPDVVVPHKDHFEELLASPS